MTFGEVVSLTKFILNVNDGQADQDISDVRLKELVNLRYAEEVNRAKQEGGRRWFRMTQQATWPEDQVTLSAPASLIRSELVEIRDITDDDLGERLAFSEEGIASTLHWKDHSTLQWGTEGPSSDRTLLFVFYAQPTKLVDDEDPLVLIPEQFQSLVAWSTAVEARTIMDEAAPGAWTQRLNDLRLDLWKFLSRGRPMLDESSSQVRGADWDIGSTPQDGSSIGG